MLSCTVPDTDWHRSQLLHPPTHTPAAWLPQSTQTHTHTHTNTHIPLSHPNSAYSTPSSPLPSGACADADQQRHVWTSGCCVIHSQSSSGIKTLSWLSSDFVSENLDLEIFVSAETHNTASDEQMVGGGAEYIQTFAFYRACPTPAKRGITEK